MVMNGGAEPLALSSRSRIYRTLYNTRSFCSKQTLSKSCSISMPTVYQNLRELIEDGLVRYTGEEMSTGGRKAQGLDIVPDARFSIGVAVNKKMLRLVAANLRLQELAYQELRADLLSARAEDSSRLAEVLETFLDDNQLDRSRLLGVAITLPGLLSPDRSLLLAAPTLGLRNVPLDMLTRDIPYPFLVENDGSACGFAECFVRGAQENLAYISLEAGVGGAVLINGNPYTGDRGQSGEFGHICVEPGGLRCNCGRNGCLEAYCSISRIEKTFGISVDAFFDGVAAHVPDYEALLFDMLRHLAVAVNDIHLVLNCKVIVGGHLSEYLQPYLPILKEYVLAGSPFTENAAFVQLSKLRHHIAPLGAALYHVRDFVNRV